MKYLCCCILALISFQSAAWAEDQETLILINSDRSIPKYKLAEESFQPSHVRVIARLDLKSLPDAPSQLKNLIKNSDASYIYCIGSPAYMLANRFAEEQILFFSAAIAWKKSDLTDYTYGVSAELLAETQMTTFRFFFPSVKTIGFIYSDTFPAAHLKEINQASSDLELAVVAKKITRASEIPQALAALSSKVDAFWLMPDPGVIASRSAVNAYFQQADTVGKPVMAYSNVFIPFGASLSISPDTSTIAKQVSSLVDRVNSGKSIAAKVEPPAASYISLNLKQAEKLNLDVRSMAIPTAHQVIE